MRTLHAPLLLGLATFALTIAGAAATAHAETLVHEEAGVQMWVPDDWDQESDEDMILLSPKGDDVVNVMLVVVDASELEAAVEVLETVLSEIVPNAEQVEEPQQVVIEGMPAMLLEARGEIEGSPRNVALALIETPKDKVLIVLALGTPEDAERHGPTLEKMLNSLKPAGD